MEFDTNAEFILAMEMVEETDRNLFLTGRAGTGKTTFLKELARRATKRMVVLAPTGIAAINAGGSTIHSFFQLPFGLYLPGYHRKNKFRMGKEKINLMRSIDLLVIDEASMLRADLLDEISSLLKRYRKDSRPFGGVQLLLIGDLQQLAPIVREEEWEEMKNHYASPYFFESGALKEAGFSCIELHRIYRQNDERFIRLLEKIRNRNADAATLQLLNSRYIPHFMPAAEEGYVTLTTHNSQSDRINEANLSALPAREQVYEAQTTGTFPETSFPTAAALHFKPGAQVMFVKNDASADHRYYNGKIGFVTRCEENLIRVSCRNEDGSVQEIDVEPAIWENTRYVIDESTKEIKTEVDGTFKQIPLRLAWAITIHKSQGLTFDKVVIDAGRAFAHGQVYVALSRCRSLEGIVLRSPLGSDVLMNDRRVDDFFQRPDLRVDNDFMETRKKEYRFGLMCEQFNFLSLHRCLYDIDYIAGKPIGKSYPRLYTDFQQTLNDFDKNVYQVAERFFVELHHLRQCDKTRQDERCIKAAGYFLHQLEALILPVIPRLSVELENRKTQEHLLEKKVELKKLLSEKQDTLRIILQNEAFNPSAYLRAKSAQFMEGFKQPTNPTEAPKDQIKTEEYAQGAFFAPLFEALRTWRTQRYIEEEKPAFMILSQKALIGIAEKMPQTKEELLSVNGIGKKKVEQYGEEILAIVARVVAAEP